MHARGRGESPPRGMISNGDRSIRIISNLCYNTLRACAPFYVVRNFHLSDPIRARWCEDLVPSGQAEGGV